MAKSQKNTPVNGTLVYKQFIQLEDGSEVQVRYNQNPDLYAGTDVILYAYNATEGKGEDKKTVVKYAVKVEDALRAKKTTTKDTIESLMAQGLTAEEIVARLRG